MPTDLFARLGDQPGVADAVAEARASVDRLLAHRVLRRRSAEISAEGALRDARASAYLDGYDASLDQVRADLGSGAALPARVTGAINVTAALGEALGTWERAPRQVLARLHVLAQGPGAATASTPAAGSAVLDGVSWGRPRVDEQAEDPLGLGAAPSPREVSARLDGLLEHLLLPTRASALVVAAVVHAELVILRPFGSADGVVARAAERLILVSRGLDPKAVTQPGVGHLESGSYTSAAAAYAAGDASAFVLQTCRAVTLGALEGLALAEALQRESA